MLAYIAYWPFTMIFQSRHWETNAVTLNYRTLSFQIVVSSSNHLYCYQDGPVLLSLVHPSSQSFPKSYTTRTYAVAASRYRKCHKFYRACRQHFYASFPSTMWGAGIVHDFTWKRHHLHHKKRTVSPVWIRKHTAALFLYVVAESSSRHIGNWYARHALTF